MLLRRSVTGTEPHIVMGATQILLSKKSNYETGLFRGQLIIYLSGQPVGRLYPFRVLRKGVVLMYVTYSDLFTFVMMITGIIALIIQIHKK